MTNENDPYDDNEERYFELLRKLIVTGRIDKKEFDEINKILKDREKKLNEIIEQLNSNNIFTKDELLELLLKIHRERIIQDEMIRLLNMQHPTVTETSKNKGTSTTTSTPTSQKTSSAEEIPPEHIILPNGDVMEGPGAHVEDISEEDEEKKQNGSGAEDDEQNYDTDKNKKKIDAIKYDDDKGKRLLREANKENENKKIDEIVDNNDDDPLLRNVDPAVKGYADLLIAKEKLKKSDYDKQIIAHEEGIRERFIEYIKNKIKDEKDGNKILNDEFTLVARMMDRQRNKDPSLLYRLGRKLRSIPGTIGMIGLGIAGVALLPVSATLGTVMVGTYAVLRGLSAYMGTNGLMTAGHRFFRQRFGKDDIRKLGASVMYDSEKMLSKNIELTKKSVDDIVNGVADYATKFKKYKITRHIISGIVGVGMAILAPLTAHNMFNGAKNIVAKKTVESAPSGLTMQPAVPDATATTIGPLGPATEPFNASELAMGPHQMTFWDVTHSTVDKGAHAITNIDISIHPGEGIWHGAKRALEQCYGNAFTAASQGEKTILIDRIKDMIIANPHKYGLEPDEIIPRAISKGGPWVKPGATINLDKLALDDMLGKYAGLLKGISKKKAGKVITETIEKAFKLKINR